MIGAIGGDVIGSIHEGIETKTNDFSLFAKDCCSRMTPSSRSSWPS